VTWISVIGRDIRLEALDFGGDGHALLLLHGLAGTAAEWEDTAAWLTQSHRVVALDQRGHGRSERRPRDVSRAAFVADAVAAIERLGLAPAVLIGQSLGGNAAFLAAAERPDLVRGLIVAEASPAAAKLDSVERIRDLLSAWPVPFHSLEAAENFLGGDTPSARAWARNLEAADDGLRPAFEVEVMVAALAAAAGPYWKEWRAIESPTLVVRGADGDLPADEAAAMVRELPVAELVTLPGGHDVHLDRPGAWRAAVEAFLAGLS
jgi:pimeloyl-ACP methyl ester carboxylesterase